MEDLSNVELKRVDSVDAAQEFFRWLGLSRSVLAIDTETTGLDWWTSNFLRLVQFGDRNTGWVISAPEWRGVIRRAIDLYEGPVAYHNANFDKHAIQSAGLPLVKGREHDTQIMHALLYPLQRHALKAVAEKIVDPMAGVGQRLLKADFKNRGWDWANVPEDHPNYWAYAALDTVLTARIAEQLWPLIHSKGLELAYEIEVSAQEVLYRVESKGLYVDRPYTERKWQEWEIELSRLDFELKQFGIQNPSSNQQIIQALQEVEDWEPNEWTPTGQAMLDQAILRSLSGNIGPRVLRYRRLRKWRSTYLTRFLEASDSSGYVHPSIGSLKARTGRMSITSPPLQTLPGKKSGEAALIRDCILPSPGNQLMAVDYDGQELRVMASYSGDSAFINTITNNPDPHTWVASQAYGVSASEVSKQMREIAKTTQYALLYGAGVPKIAATAGVGEAQVKQFLAGYFAALPGVKQFIDTVQVLARQRLGDDGIPWARSWGGRRLEVDPDKPYKLLNALIQGSCADVLKHKIVALDSAGLGDLIYLPVHDELLFDVPPEDFAEVSRAVEEIMTETSFAVPLTVHASDPMERWGDIAR